MEELHSTSTKIKSSSTRKRRYSQITTSTTTATDHSHKIHPRPRSPRPRSKVSSHHKKYNTSNRSNINNSISVLPPTTVLRASTYKQNHIHGNFDKYSGIQPFLIENNDTIWDDTRLSVIPDYLFTSPHCQVLDIGCNTGYFLLLLMEKYGTVNTNNTNISSTATTTTTTTTSPTAVIPFIETITGIDISNESIKRARTLLAYREQEYQTKHTNNKPSNSTSASKTSTFNILQSLPLSIRQTQKVPLKYALLQQHNTSINSSTPSSSTTNLLPWYSRIYFRTENFIANDNLYTYNANMYDVIFCCNVTKWIHLHNGDVGILLLFRKIYHILKSSGYFVLTIEPWEEYATDAKINKEIFDIFTNLRMKPEQFESYLIQKVQFTLKEKLYIPEKKQHTIPSTLYIFQKP